MSATYCVHRLVQPLSTSSLLHQAGCDIRAGSTPGGELLQQYVDDVSEGRGDSGLLIQQAQQGLQGAQGLQGMAGVPGPVKVLVACQQQGGNGVPPQHLHPHTHKSAYSQASLLPRLCL